jgi:heat shock protein HslJ
MARPAREEPLTRRFPVRRFAMVLALAVTMAVSMAACSSSGGGLTGKTWQWTASTTKAPASQAVVPDPQNYNLVFKDTATYSGKADCNNISGGYTTSGSDGLALTPGPTTLAQCPPGSMSDAYIQGLALTKTYAISGSTLTLTAANGDTMTFAAK